MTARCPSRPGTTPSRTTTTSTRTRPPTGPASASGRRAEMDLFTYDFMVRALVGALIIGLAAPALGIYLVQRRLSLIGDGIGHVALTGVGVGLLLNHSPVLTAVIVAALGAVGVELIQIGRASCRERV